MSVTNIVSCEQMSDATKKATCTTFAAYRTGAWSARALAAASACIPSAQPAWAVHGVSRSCTHKARPVIGRMLCTRVMYAPVYGVLSDFESVTETVVRFFHLASNCLETSELQTSISNSLKA